VVLCLELLALPRGLAPPFVIMYDEFVPLSLIRLGKSYTV